MTSFGSGMSSPLSPLRSIGGGGVMSVPAVVSSPVRALTSSLLLAPPGSQAFDDETMAQQQYLAYTHAHADVDSRVSAAGVAAANAFMRQYGGAAMGISGGGGGNSGAGNDPFASRSREHLFDDVAPSGAVVEDDIADAELVAQVWGFNAEDTPRPAPPPPPAAAAIQPEPEPSPTLLHAASAVTSPVQASPTPNASVGFDSLISPVRRQQIAASIASVPTPFQHMFQLPGGGSSGRNGPPSSFISPSRSRRPSAPASPINGPFTPSNSALPLIAPSLLAAASPANSLAPPTVEPIRAGTALSLLSGGAGGSGLINGTPSRPISSQGASRPASSGGLDTPTTADDDDDSGPFRTVTQAQRAADLLAAREQHRKDEEARALDRRKEAAHAQYMQLVLRHVRTRLIQEGKFVEDVSPANAAAGPILWPPDVNEYEAQLAIARRDQWRGGLSPLFAPGSTGSGPAAPASPLPLELALPPIDQLDVYKAITGNERPPPEPVSPPPQRRKSIRASPGARSRIGASPLSPLATAAPPPPVVDPFASLPFWIDPLDPSRPENAGKRYRFNNAYEPPPAGEWPLASRGPQHSWQELADEEEVVAYRKILWLCDIKALALISLDGLLELILVITERAFDVEVLTRAGDEADKVYLVKTGEVQVKMERGIVEEMEERRKLAGMSTSGRGFDEDEDETDDAAARDRRHEDELRAAALDPAATLLAHLHPPAPPPGATTASGAPVVLLPTDPDLVHKHVEIARLGPLSICGEDILIAPTRRYTLVSLTPVWLYEVKASDLLRCFGAESRANFLVAIAHTQRVRERHALVKSRTRLHFHAAPTLFRHFLDQGLRRNLGRAVHNRSTTNNNANANGEIDASSTTGVAHGGGVSDAASASVGAEIDTLLRGGGPDALRAVLQDLDAISRASRHPYVPHSPDRVEALVRHAARTKDRNTLAQHDLAKERRRRGGGSSKTASPARSRDVSPTASHVKPPRDHQEEKQAAVTMPPLSGASSINASPASAGNASSSSTTTPARFRPGAGNGASFTTPPSPGALLYTRGITSAPHLSLSGGGGGGGIIGAPTSSSSSRQVSFNLGGSSSLSSSNLLSPARRPSTTTTPPSFGALVSPVRHHVKRPSSESPGSELVRAQLAATAATGPGVGRSLGAMFDGLTDLMRVERERVALAEQLKTVVVGHQGLLAPLNNDLALDGGTSASSSGAVGGVGGGGPASRSASTKVDPRRRASVLPTQAMHESPFAPGGSFARHAPVVAVVDQVEPGSNMRIARVAVPRPTLPLTPQQLTPLSPPLSPTPTTMPAPTATTAAAAAGRPGHARGASLSGGNASPFAMKFSAGSVFEKSHILGVRAASLAFINTKTHVARNTVPPPRTQLSAMVVLGDLATAPEEQTYAEIATSPTATNNTAAAHAAARRRKEQLVAHANARMRASASLPNLAHAPATAAAHDHEHDSASPPRRLAPAAAR